MKIITKQSNYKYILFYFINKRETSLMQLRVRYAWIFVSFVAISGLWLPLHVKYLSHLPSSFSESDGANAWRLQFFSYGRIRSAFLMRSKPASHPALMPRFLPRSHPAFLHEFLITPLRSGKQQCCNVSNFFCLK